MAIRAERYHDFSCGHRVVGHEGACQHLHGHNYRITFSVEGELDSVGRVLDFSVIKSELCEWLEMNWDHKFLMWEEDPIWTGFMAAGPHCKEARDSVVLVPFNPTAENMGTYLLEVVGPDLLARHGVKLVKVVVEETRKCAAEVSL